MRIFAPGFLLGVCVIYLLTAVPSLFWLIPLFSLMLFINFVCSSTPQKSKFILGFMLGLAWLVIYLNLFLSSPLPQIYQNKKMIISGVIVGLPKRTKKYDSFLFKSQKRLIKLNWYFNYKKLIPGDQWQLFVKLKSPKQFKNTSGFDYQKWLFQQGITATGYIIKSNINKKILPVFNALEKSETYAAKQHSEISGFRYFWRGQLINRWRDELLRKINNSLYLYPMKKFIKALTIGSREGLKQTDWQVLQQTGTSHLVAISGLHIGLVAGLVFFVVSFLWRRIAWFSAEIPAQVIAAVFSLLAALTYCALAGFSLPTQRALVMLSVVLVALILKRRIIPWHAFSLALFLVVFFHPLSVLSMSFWLSFCAVAVIVYGVSGRMRNSSKLQQMIKIQLVVTIGLMPLSILFFHKTSLVAPIANFIAIPWVGFIVVPLSLLGTLLLLISQPIAHWILLAAVWNMQGVWYFLQYLSSFKFSGINFSFPSITIFFIFLSAIILLLAPRGFPAKYLSVFLLLPVIFMPVHFHLFSLNHLWGNFG